LLSRIRAGLQERVEHLPGGHWCSRTPR
jgi:hypothetical protein